MTAFFEKTSLISSLDSESDEVVSIGVSLLNIIFACCVGALFIASGLFFSLVLLNLPLAIARLDFRYTVPIAVVTVDAVFCCTGRNAFVSVNGFSN